MEFEQRVIKRLNELIAAGNDVLERSRTGQNLWQQEASWVTSSKNLLQQSFGTDSAYYKDFTANCITESFTPRIGILEAAKYDFEHGYIFDMRGLLAADVFNDLLEQHLLRQGFYIPAAVVAGCVLEDGLRKICIKQPNLNMPDEPKMNYMNDQLKDKAYNALTHKNVAVWINLRNDAAHGKWNDKNADEANDLRRQVANMIPGIRVFLSQHLT